MKGLSPRGPGARKTRICVAVVLCLAGHLRAGELIFTGITLEASRFAGVALSSTEPSPAQIIVTLVGSNGQPASVSAANPQTLTLPPGQQTTFLVRTLFQAPDGNYWLRVQADRDFITGMVLTGSADGETLDAASPAALSTEQVLPLVDTSTSAATRIWVVNPGATGASARLEMISQLGGIVGSRVLSLAPGEQASVDAALVQTTAAPLYVRVASDAPVAAMAVSEHPGLKTRAGIGGLARDGRIATAYAPQLVTDGGALSLGAVNQTDQTVVVTVTAFRADGGLYVPPQVRANPVTRALPPRAAFQEPLTALFSFAEGEVFQGWLRVETNVPALSVYLVQAGAASGSLTVSAVPTTPFTEAIFPHQANAGGFSTILSLLNQAALTANVTIASIRADGTIAQSIQKILTPGQRLSQAVASLLPQAADVSGGMIWIRSNLPVYLSQSFGTPQVLAALTPASAAPSFRPDRGRVEVSVLPPLAPVETGTSTQFRAILSNTANQQVVWNVNGVAGGNAQVGTISAAGLYRGPAQPPSPQVIAVEARSVADPERSSGSSIEVLKRQSLGSSFALPRAVAYVGSLRRLFTAELAVLAGKQPQANGVQAIISEVPPQGERTPILTLPGDQVEKMLPLELASGVNYMLMAGRETGQVYRLQLDTRSLVVIASGLNRPSSLALDPLSGDLLVTEEGGGITVIARATFDPSAAAKNLVLDWPAATPRFFDSDLPVRREAALLSDPDLSAPTARLFPAEEPTGIVVDSCNGLVYFTERRNGRLMAYNRRTGGIRQILTGLVNPGEMLGLYRNGLSCQQGFTIFLAEEGDATRPGRVLQIDPLRGTFIVWMNAPQVSDIVLLRAGNPYGENGKSAVTFSQSTPAAPGVSLVVVDEIYSSSRPPELREQPPGSQFSAFGTITFGTFGSPAGGVTVELTGGRSASTTTDIFGKFEFSGLTSGRHRATPTSTRFTFDPEFRDFTVGSFNVVGLDFRATIRTFTISGRVTDRTSAGIPGVTLAVGFNVATTDTAGRYTIRNLLPNTTYQVRPARAGFLFVPESRQVALGEANVTGIDFTTLQVEFTVSGRIVGPDSRPVANIPIVVCRGTQACASPEWTTTSGVDGRFTVPKVPNGQYHVRPRFP